MPLVYARVAAEDQSAALSACLNYEGVGRLITTWKRGRPGELFHIWNYPCRLNAQLFFYSKHSMSFWRRLGC